MTVNSLVELVRFRNTLTFTVPAGLMYPMLMMKPCVSTVSVRLRGARSHARTDVLGAHYKFSCTFVHSGLKTKTGC